MEEEAKDDFYVLKSKTSGQTAQGAMVLIEPSSGKVVGCIGQLGEKTTSRGQNRATQTLRSPGSSFKPLADLVPGIEEGIVTPATIYADLATVFNEGTVAEYKPKNYNGFKGIMSLRRAVTTSQNIPFVKIMNELGTAKSIEYLKKMGISTLDEGKDVGLSLAIGGLTNGISPLEMAGAYAAIANNGNYIEPTFYTKVEDTDGKVVMEPNQKTEKVCSEETAYVVKDLLKSGIDVAAKTGTSNDDKDRWLCGFSNYYAGAAWYGYDTPEEVNTGGKRNPAGQLFSQVMKKVHTGLEGSTFTQPANVVSATVCRTSGRLATDKCTDKYTEIFVKGHLPETCDAHENTYLICKDSNLLANEYCPESSRENRNYGYVPEKERLGLWNTPDVKKATSAPTGYCTIHKKPEETKPTEPTTNKTEPTKPTTSPTTGSTTGGNTSSTNKTESTN